MISLRIAIRLVSKVLVLAMLIEILATSFSGATFQGTTLSRANQSGDPLLKSFRFRSIGPAAMSGRVDDVVAVESDARVMYVGFATGGVWKTINNGTTWTPIFDTYGSGSIGDIEISQRNPNLVWVGTGEANNRQSSSYGDGIYKSGDGGSTFRNVGLKDTQTIARIVIDPRDDNVVYVAAPGHLFGPNPDGGIYKTSDGGISWNKIKFIDQNTGFTDLVMDPLDPNTLYAASYQRRRAPWGFNGGGPGSGIWKTTDAGQSWKRLTNGLPATDLEIGRIGLDVSRSKPGVVMAIIEVGKYSVFGSNMMDDGSEVPGGLSRRPRVSFPQLQSGQSPDPRQWGTYRSEDGGETWRITSNQNDRPVYYSQIRIDPKDDRIVYTLGAPLYRSTDSGRTFKPVAGLAHSDNHALWIDPRDSNHLVDGNDGGIEVSYDRGATWEHLNHLAVTQFYAISADMRKPYYVCGGTQDNHIECGPSAVRNSVGILNEDWYRVRSGDGFYTQNDPTDWAVMYSTTPFGAVARTDLKTARSVNIRPRATPPVLNSEMRQRGLSLLDPDPPNIVPTPPANEQPRFNWVTPILLSPHDPKTVYVGGDRLYISHDRGETYARTADLTRAIDRRSRSIMGVPNDRPMASKAEGVPAYSTITTISESPLKSGVLWVGTDDGNLQISNDGGATWRNVIKNVHGVPNETKVSRVEASHADVGTCYVAFDNHENDDMKPYVFVTTDYGMTWKSISSNLPVGNVRVIREGLKNRNLLFAGTEQGLYISLNAGAAWERFMNGLPTVRVDDLLIHPRDGDLIVGTHGRSIWIVDDISPLEELASSSILNSNAHLFSIRPATLWLEDITLNRQVSGGAKGFRGQNHPPGTAISYFLRVPVSGVVTITMTNKNGEVVREFAGPNEAGINRMQWNPRSGPATPMFDQGAGEGGSANSQGEVQPVIVPGVYTIKLSAGGRDYTTKLVVEADRLDR